MADSLTSSGSKLKIPPIPNIESPLPNERIWEYLERVERAGINRGSRYPPFSIEPMQWERERLGTPMTAEERFLRKQWILDQKLSPNEPRYVKEAIPMFKARRLLRRPMDIVQGGLTKYVGPSAAGGIRSFVPKLFMFYILGSAWLYHMTFNSKNWEKHSGFLIYGSKPAKFPGEDGSGVMPDPDIYDSRGFYRRTTHLNAKTSAAGQ